MNIEAFREYCLSFPETTESFPFDEQALVFKVAGKMFALTNVDRFEGINLKCDPDVGEELRAEYEGIRPGWHMNKRHWITVATDGSVPDKLLWDLIGESYWLVVAKMSKRDRNRLEGKAAEAPRS